MKKKLAAVVLAAAGLRLAALTGTGEAVMDWLEEKAADGRLVSATLNVELGGAKKEDDGEEDAPAVTMYIPTVSTPEPQQSGDADDTEAITDSYGLAEPTANIVAAALDGGDIFNNTSFTVDPASLLAEGISLKLPKEGPQILIIHTHGSEAYAPAGTDQYVATGEARTIDLEHNVIRVGDELQELLEGYGLSVIHDRELYDYPSYTGSYSRSGAAVEGYLAQYPNIAVVIDLHRDALGSGDTVYKTMAEVQGQASAQLMFVIGTGENGLEHSYWRENLKLALCLQSAMDARWTALTRPINLAKERYNQHYTTGSLILEVGSSGNTLQEALLAIRLFGETAGPVLADMVEE